MNHLISFLSTPALLMGLIALIGLVIQKASPDKIIRGTISTAIGFLILKAGSLYLQNYSLNAFGEIFTFAFQVRGIVPNMEAVSALMIEMSALNSTLILGFGMCANMILGRFSGLHAIFLNGHHALYMACLLALLFEGCGMDTLQTVFCGSLLLGLLMSALPSLAQKAVREVNGSDRIALGHFSVISYMVSYQIGNLVFYREQSKRNKKEKKQENNLDRRQEKEQEESLLMDAEKIRFPKSLAFLRDTNCAITLVMGLTFLCILFAASRRADFFIFDSEVLNIQPSGWFLFGIMQALQFTVGINIILIGVRMVLSEIVPAFKDIARKLVPDVRPALAAAFSSFSCAI